MNYYWVYLPGINEAGTMVQADSFEKAFKAGCDALHPRKGVEVQVQELGHGASFIAGEEV